MGSRTRRSIGTTTRGSMTEHGIFTPQDVQRADDTLTSATRHKSNRRCQADGHIAAGKTATLEVTPLLHTDVRGAALSGGAWHLPCALNTVGLFQRTPPRCAIGRGQSRPGRSGDNQASGQHPGVFRTSPCVSLARETLRRTSRVHGS